MSDIKVFFGTERNDGRLLEKMPPFIDSAAERLKTDNEIWDQLCARARVDGQMIVKTAQAEDPADGWTVV
jgi:hypothetical protein